MNDEVARAVRLLATFREEHGSFDGWVITVPLSRPVIVDVVMGTTRASVGRGTLRFGTEDALVLEKDGSRLTYEL